MTPDDEFLHAFFGLSLASSEFRHRDHLRLAWLAVRRHGGVAAEEVVRPAFKGSPSTRGTARRITTP